MSAILVCIYVLLAAVALNLWLWGADRRRAHAEQLAAAEQTREATLVGKLAEQMRASMARAAQAERNLALMTKRAEQAERERDELRAELAHRRIIEVRNADRLERMLNSEAQP